MTLADILDVPMNHKKILRLMAKYVARIRIVNWKKRQKHIVKYRII